GGWRPRMGNFSVGRAAMNQRRMRAAPPLARVLLLAAFVAASRAWATPEDASREEGTRLLSEARAHLEKGVAPETRQAAEGYERAAAIFRKLGDAGHEARALSGLAQCHLQVGETREARDMLECALVLARAGDDRPAEGEILSSLGESYFALG